MDKKELANTIAEMGLTDTKAQATKIVENVFDQIRMALKRGEDVSIFPFGIFKSVKKAARQARNPQTGEAIAVPEHSVVKFTPAKALKDAVR